MIEVEISKTQPSRLLVTGGAGFIGSNFVKHSLKSGCKVLNVDSLTYAANAEVLTELLVSSNCTRLNGRSLRLVVRRWQVYRRVQLQSSFALFGFKSGCRPPC
jgi:nucleoside-diphosphate-sugar epimerase